MNSNPDYIEYMVRQKTDLNLILKRSLLVAAISLLSFSLAGTLIIISPAISAQTMLMLITACAALGAGLIYVFWKYVNVSFEYIITDATFDMDKILGQRKRKKVISVKISSMKLVAPYSGDYIEEFRRLAPEKKYICCSSLTSPDLYFAVFMDPEHDERLSAVFFDVTERTLTLMRRANPRAVKH